MTYCTDNVCANILINDFLNGLRCLLHVGHCIRWNVMSSDDAVLVAPDLFDQVSFNGHELSHFELVRRVKKDLGHLN